ncbi:MAG: biopolymer transporter ExbD [bacterium]
MKTGNDEDLTVSGINVTPLVDITLVLLIIFMVTATFVSEQAINVNLPKIESREKAPQPAIIVALGKDGKLKMMKKEVTIEELIKQMVVETKIDPNVKVLLKAQKDLPYFKVAEVLEAIKTGGVIKVALAVERK